MRNNKNIPFSVQDITEHDINNVASVLRSGWLTHGEYSKKLEQLFCEFTGAKYSTTVSSCTAGLHLSCLVAGFGPGDEVIVPAQTHTATANAVEYTGAKVVFSDVDPLSGNILVSEIEAKLNQATRGVIPVHMAGNPCDMSGIKNLCDKNDLILIEDCAHAIGTKYNNVHSGNFGIAGNFSFYPTKQVTTGEGGMIITNDESVINMVNKLKAFGIDSPPELRTRPGVYDVNSLGYNYRMTDFQAALGAGQMERYRENVRKRRANAKLYSDILKACNELSFPEYSDQNSYFLFQIIFKKGIDRDKILTGLSARGIGLSIHYATPVPLMTYYKEKYGCKVDDYPNAIYYGNQCISLPVHPFLSQADIEYISENLLNLLETI